MKFGTIFLAALGFSTFVAALPAPVPAADASLDLLEKRDLVERDPTSDLTKRNSCNLDVDVQVCITAIVNLNKQWSSKPRTIANCQSWAAAVVVEVNALIAVVKSYPAGCNFPPINVCVDILVQLLVVIFAQLKLFCDGGLLGIIVLTIDVLLLLCRNLFEVVVALLLLIQVKIQVSIVAQIIAGCKGKILDIFIAVLVFLGL